ncbi:MAG: glycosyltransferase [Bacteroidetes bacterium]|nr:MAG: glycosyltransferase [Bacteroidota bacterium]
MGNPDIVFGMTGDLYRNSRAIKQVRALAAQDWSIHVIHLGESTPNIEWPRGITTETLTTKNRRGIRFFREVHKAFLETAGGINARCYHASDLYVLSALAKASRRFDAVYTFDSRELYAHVSSTERKPWTGWFWSLVESQYLPGATAVFTVSERIALHLENEYRIRRPVLVQNVPPKTAVIRSTKLADLAGLDPSTPIILHLGLMRPARGCDLLIEAMKHVNGAHLVFLGSGEEQKNLQEQSRSLGLEAKVSFLDPVEPDSILEYAAGASVGVSLVQDTCLNHRFALPNKLFDYLAAGVPVLASDLPEIRSIVEGYNVGKTVDQRSPDKIADALNQMIHADADRKTWIQNADRLCETFNWESASQRFIKTFRQILPRYSSAKKSFPESSKHTLGPETD